MNGRRNEGEATFDYDDQTWRLRFDFNAMADFEAETGLNCLETLADLQPAESNDDPSALGQPSVSAITLRALIWACLREYHPDVTIRQAGRLVKAGMAAFSRAAESAMPPLDPEEGAPEKSKATTRRVA